MSLRSLRALCLTSFFIADVRDGLGPFLGIFLTQRHWQAEDIGLLMSVGGIAGLLATLPAGFITDSSRHKRLLLAGVCLVITLTTLLLWFSQKTSVVALSQVASGICAAFVGPLIAGITLGLARQRGFSAQMGKNEAFNHAGNFFTALMAGAIAWYWGIGGIQGGKDITNDEVKVLTKELHGARPKNIIMSVLYGLLRYFNISTVYAIDSDYHVKSDLVKASYSSLWLEMGGEKQARGWYKLPAQEIKKSIEEVKSKHRSQFIKREGIKELIQLDMANALRQITLRSRVN